MDAPVIFSARDAEWFEPVGAGGRAYLLAPLTYRERQAYRADVVRLGGIYPPQPVLLEAMRDAMRAANPVNLSELLAVIDAAASDEPDASALVPLAQIEAACSGHPAYDDILAARQRHMGAMPWVAARHALRDWRGPRLPEFARVRGLVPEVLLDTLPPEELEAIGWRAVGMMQPERSAEKNSEGLLPLPESPEVLPEA